MVQLMLRQIVEEVDLIPRMAELAAREVKKLPYMSPFLFKDFLPVIIKSYISDQSFAN